MTTRATCQRLRRAVLAVATVVLLCVLASMWVLHCRQSLGVGGGLLLYVGELGLNGDEELRREDFPDWLHGWVRNDFQEPEYEWPRDDARGPSATELSVATGVGHPAAISLGGLTPPARRPYLGFLSSCHRLEYLQLSGICMFGEGFDELRDLKGLRYLGLRHCDSEFSQLTDSFMPAVSRYRELRFLSLAESKLSDRGLNELSLLRKLRYLNLARTKVTDSGLRILSEFPELRYLGLARTKITDEGMVHLRSLQHLEDLNLSETQITDAGILHLANLKSLRALYLTRTKVSDSALVHLRELKGLEILGLSNTRVSHEGLRLIAGLPRLKELHLARTDIGDEALPTVAEMGGLEICIRTPLPSRRLPSGPSFRVYCRTIPMFGCVPFTFGRQVPWVRRMLRKLGCGRQG